VGHGGVRAGYRRRLRSAHVRRLQARIGGGEMVAGADRGKCGAQRARLGPWNGAARRYGAIGAGSRRGAFAVLVQRDDGSIKAAASEPVRDENPGNRPLFTTSGAELWL
jgi:hypothetical protein